MAQASRHCGYLLDLLGMLNRVLGAVAPVRHVDWPSSKMVEQRRKIVGHQSRK